MKVNNYVVPEYFSAEQKEAILIDGTNILVSAAAGCGKTTILVERVLRKIIQDQVPLNKLIVVTFTEAAASELKDRVKSTLNKELLINEDNGFIKEQLNQLKDAYIMTFHALCLRLLKENHGSFNYENTLQPGSNLILKNLKFEAFNQLDREYAYESDYQDLKLFYSKIIDNEKLHNTLETVRKIALDNGGFSEFIKFHQTNNVADNLFKDNNLKEAFKDILLSNLNQIIDTLKVCQVDKRNSFELNTNISSLIDQMQVFKNQVLHEQYQNLKEDVLAHKFFRKSNSYENEEDIPLLNSYYDEIKNIFRKRIIYFCINDENIKEIIENNNKTALTLLKYAQIYEYNLKQAKRKTGLIEFDDFEHDILDLLYDNNDQPSAIAQKLSNHFNEILIDEYQDTNIVQEKIVQALAHGSNTFMVGDLKQSIYRFRRATPQLFVDKYEKYKVNDGGVVIDLSDNFRSKNGVLQTTNFVFKSIFCKQIGGIDYDENNQLRFKNHKLDELYPNEYYTKFFFNVVDDISKDNKEEADEQLKVETRYQESAKSITKEIQKLMKQGVKLQEISILLTTRTRGEILLDSLDQANISYMFHTKNGFFATYDVKDITNLLKTLINPKEDILLLGSLHSLFFNLNENDILNISLESGKSYYDKLKNSSYQKEFELLTKLITYSRNNHPLDLIDYIYQETPYLSYIVNFKSYEKVLINITNLKNLINENYDYYNSFEYLLEDLEKGINDPFDSMTPAVLSQKDDVINIMSIHQSKGLEFNYVFLFDDSTFKTYEYNKYGIEYYKKQLILPYYNSELKIKLDNPLKKLKRFLEEKEIVSEKLRLLYVAMTRAKLQLYLFTNISQKSLDKNLLFLNNNQDWLLNENLIMNQEYLINYVLLAMLRHRDSLLLRTGHDTNFSDEIYYYNDKLAIFEQYDNEIDSIPKTYQKKELDFKVVAPKVSTTRQVENITPSKQTIAQLDFEQIKSFDTYQQGTNVHKVLELIDFDNLSNLEDLFEKYDIVQTNRDGILAFIQSDFFKTTIINNTYYKEYRFSYLENVKLINGIIDLYVESADTIYIIDYKSDNLSVEKLKESYLQQLQTYYDVISTTSNKNIICYLYSIYNQTFIKLI